MGSDMKTHPYETSLPLLGFAAWSGAGKTTLLTRLLPVLRHRGLEVALIKHAHHDFDIDHPGKDSHALRKAGAGQVLVASSRRLALMVENPPGQEIEPELSQLVARIDPARADLILVEGFKREPIPKIEVHRPAVGKPLLCTDDPNIIAVATDRPEVVPAGMRILPLDQVDLIAAFIAEYFDLPGFGMESRP
jgi:molybdopterin-guanine dinucleotide biosynthesis protein MobB